MIRIDNLKARKDNDLILKGVTLEISPGKHVLLMGKNGSGKTSFARVLLGDPSYDVESGTITLIDGNKEVDLLSLSAEERAKKGLFVGFQSPVDIPGVDAYAFLYASYRQLHPDDHMVEDTDSFEEQVRDAAGKIGLRANLLTRGVNENFSGGERKKMELLQMVVLRPSYVVLDEPDSGLDADAVDVVRRAIDMLGKTAGVLVISHDAKRMRIDRFDEVLVMSEGTITERGGMELIDRIASRGYE